jgi:cytochrome c553
MKKTTLALLLGLFAFVGTAVAADPPAAPGRPVIEAGMPPKLPARNTKIDWEKMSVSQRKSYMKKTVLPEMKKLFVGFDSKRYKDMSCATCHGEKAAETKFKMPNPDLPKLPAPTDRQGFMALQQKKPEAAKFMGTQVKPAALLNVDEWTPTNPKGFGCYGCHTQEAAPAAPAAPAAAPAPGKPAGGGW